MNIVLYFTCSKEQRKTLFNFFGCAGDGDYINNNLSRIINFGGFATATTLSIANLKATDLALAVRLRLLYGAGAANSDASTNELADLIWALSTEVCSTELD